MRELQIETIRTVVTAGIWSSPVRFRSSRCIRYSAHVRITLGWVTNQSVLPSRKRTHTDTQTFRFALARRGVDLRQLTRAINISPTSWQIRSRCPERGLPGQIDRCLICIICKICTVSAPCLPRGICMKHFLRTRLPSAIYVMWLLHNIPHNNVGKKKMQII